MKERFRMAGRRIGKELYYITHIDNIPSILKRGILSHERVETECVQYTPIYDKQIVERRRKRITPKGKNLWEYANLYFQPRNAMLYRVWCEKKSLDDIGIVAIRGDILKKDGVFVTTGNAASPLSQFLPVKRESLKQIRNSIQIERWSDVDGSKRKIMAECLVPDIVPAEFIRAIYVPSYDTANRLKANLQSISIPIIPEPYMFFQPGRRIQLTPYLSVVDGDMFFSRMQTLTISVNCKGVMGKGLASSAKYLFPDVYVHYQDVCRQRLLQMGRPYLYKRETSLDYFLADEPTALLNANSGTYFLLFPTKNHWREKADINGIKKGLEWLQTNYKAEGIESLAVPALGCGLGWLEWYEVGPLLYKYLSTLDIPVSIYLPTEKKVPDAQLSKNFLEG